MVKAREENLLPDLQKHLTLADHEHAFRKGTSMTNALMEIDNHITEGLNKDKPSHRTVLVALDMRAAFDTVKINNILETICQSALPPMRNDDLVRISKEDRHTEDPATCLLSTGKLDPVCRREEITARTGKDHYIR